MKILGIETSCDETAIAIVEDGHKIVVNEVFTQEIHTKFGGVVPEVASRNHIIKIFELLDTVFKKTGYGFDDIDAIAVTQGPGLIGALLVGLNTAKTIAYMKDKPLVPVNHIEGHLYANILTYPELKPPFLGLIVSGGHTNLIKVEDYHIYKSIGRTVDDAIGEAYDKVSKLLGLGYPGGPVIDKISKEGNPIYDFPVPVPRNNFFNFSFSGLKTAVRTFIQKNPDAKKEDIAASFQKSAIKALILRVEKYLKDYEKLPIVVAGGVAANSYLRAEMTKIAEKYGVSFYIPPIKLCTDNAAMVASLGYFLYKKGRYLDGDDKLTINALSSMPIV